MRLAFVTFVAASLSMTPSWAIETTETIAWEWHGALPEGKAVEIRGVTGDIRAVPSESGEVEVTARIEGSESAAETATQLRIFPGAHGLVVCSVAKGSDECVSDPLAAPGSRIDFEVRVPSGVRLAARTVNGGIQAHGLTSDVEADTVNGGVSVSTSGSVKAHTVNGSIDASLLKPVWAQAPEFTTVNGRISVQIPGKTKAAVQAETRNGRVVTSVPGFRGETTDQRIDGSIGGGGSANPMILRTINGAIELREKR